ncbi:MAG: HdeA/HdeB family chaperone, partial [Chloroflexota bacterium]
MIRKLILAGVAGAFMIAAPASAQVQIEMSQITCKDFTGYDPATQDFIGNWMR